jgi:hypothetical protein
MTRFVVLPPADDRDVSAGYDVRLGPLAFVTLADTLGRTLGESSENVGATITPTERRPKPLSLKLPVRGATRDVDPRVAGLRLRRQVEQLLSNQRWLASGLFFHWAPDAELDAWVDVRGGSLEEADQSIVAGEWTLTLESAYVVGAPGRQRLGRRLELADRRSGLVPLDTRAMLYSADHAAQALPARPLITPGDVAGVLLTRNRPPSSSALGPQRGIRRLWRELGAQDGDVASFLPDSGVLTADRAYLDLEEPGAVRVWDTSSSSVNIADPASWSPERDTTPELIGWERVYGQPRLEAAPLAVDNGVSRLVWLGPAAGQGLALEFWDDAVGHFTRLGRVNAAVDVREVNVVELTQERAVLEWRGGSRALRAVLQRGWYGPRLEGYNDDPAGDAVLEYVPDAGAPAIAASSVAWVDELTAGAQTVLWAKGTDADVRSTFAGGGVTLNGDGVAYAAPAGQPGAVVAQLGTPAGPSDVELASVAIADVRVVPVLITR